jgi:hypothetical protein
LFAILGVFHRAAGRIFLVSLRGLPLKVVWLGAKSKLIEGVNADAPWGSIV